MSPVGDAFRARCRMFPSLINCCTIDWYDQWPEQALLSVSSKFLAHVDLNGEETNAAVAAMCVDIHISVATTAERFYSELRRRYRGLQSLRDLVARSTWFGWVWCVLWQGACGDTWVRSI